MRGTAFLAEGDVEYFGLATPPPRRDEEEADEMRSDALGDGWHQSLEAGELGSRPRTPPSCKNPFAGAARWLHQDASTDPPLLRQKLEHLGQQG